MSLSLHDNYTQEIQTTTIKLPPLTAIKTHYWCRLNWLWHLIWHHTFVSTHPRLTTIRQRVRDFLHYSIKPNLFWKGDTSTSKSFNYNQLLPIGCLDTQIISCTTFLAHDLDQKTDFQESKDHVWTSFMSAYRYFCSFQFCLSTYPTPWSFVWSHLQHHTWWWLWINEAPMFHISIPQTPSIYLYTLNKKLTNRLIYGGFKNWRGYKKRWCCTINPFMEQADHYCLHKFTVFIFLSINTALPILQHDILGWLQQLICNKFWAYILCTYNQVCLDFLSDLRKSRRSQYGRLGGLGTGGGGLNQL